MELQIRGVSKTYPNGVHALKDVTLTIPAGMYGLLGPNGAGKSTLMRILATLQEADSGSATLSDPSTSSGQAPSAGSGDGIDVLRQKDEVRKTLGCLPQEFGVYPNVNAEALLDHFALLKGIAERRVDSAGRETELPMNEWVEIGIFAAAEPDEVLGKPLYVQKHRIRSGRQTITVTVSQRPARGGIDPYNLLDWEEGDNIEQVKISGDR